MGDRIPDPMMDPEERWALLFLLVMLAALAGCVWGYYTSLPRIEI